MRGSRRTIFLSSRATLPHAALMMAFPTEPPSICFSVLLVALTLHTPN